MNLAVVNMSETEAMSTTLPERTGKVMVFVTGWDENHTQDNNQDSIEKASIR